MNRVVATVLAGSILALRIVPLAAEVGERFMARRRGLVAPLGILFPEDLVRSEAFAVLAAFGARASSGRANAGFSAAASWVAASRPACTAAP